MLATLKSNDVGLVTYVPDKVLTPLIKAIHADDFDRLVAAALRNGGPTLIAARIDNKPAVATIDRDPVQIRERFMRGLGVRREPDA